MDLTLIYTIVGFGLAGYSVIANDSIQTLGTFIASKKKWFAWYILAGSASSVMIIALAWGWYSYDGDISYGRLTRIPYQEIQWYHAVAPAILLLLTRIGIPVSTTFLVLSAFASTVVLEKMLVKSIVGYGIAATVAYICWIGVSKFINEKLDEVKGDFWIKFWRNAVMVGMVITRCCKYCSILAKTIRYYFAANCYGLLHCASILYFLYSWWSNTKGSFRKNRYKIR